jgi:hypothetical protein
MSARVSSVAALLLLVLAACGCGAQVSGDAVESARNVRTAAQMDTAIARSSLPGAGVVDRALRESGRQGTRAASLDSLR